MYLGKYDIAWIFRFLRWITLNTIVIISDDDVRNAETYYELFLNSNQILYYSVNNVVL